MGRQSAYIITSVFIFSIFVSLLDAVVRPGYFVKISIKIVFFFLIPLLFFMANKKDRDSFKRLFAFGKRGLWKPLLLGAVVYAAIVLGYFLTRGVIDFSNATSDLTDGMGVTAQNFLYVSLYISFANSFLEEFFFRGYGFMALKRYIGRKPAYLSSSLAFALYHVGMLSGMFGMGVSILLLAGLAAGGCIFNRLDEWGGSLYPSWFVHMFANFAINTVGMGLFGVL